MKIYYGSSGTRSDVSGDAPIEASLESTLDAFRELDPDEGFLGVILDPQFTLQFATHGEDAIRVELLDTSLPAFDGCIADRQFAESLIRAAAAGQDVFNIARASRYQWEHTRL